MQDFPPWGCNDPNQNTIVHQRFSDPRNWTVRRRAARTGCPSGLCWATAQTQLGDGNRGAHRRLPLGVVDYTTCVALSLSYSGAAISHVNMRLFDGRSDECNIFLSKKILQEDSKPKCQWTFLGVGSVQCALSRGLSDTAQLGVPSTWRDVRLSVFFLFLVLALKNDFLSNSLWSLSAFLTGIIRYTGPSALHYRVSAE